MRRSVRQTKDCIDSSRVCSIPGISIPTLRPFLPTLKNGENLFRRYLVWEMCRNLKHSRNDRRNEENLSSNEPAYSLRKSLNCKGSIQEEILKVINSEPCRFCQLIKFIQLIMRWLCAIFCTWLTYSFSIIFYSIEKFESPYGHAETSIPTTACLDKERLNGNFWWSLSNYFDLFFGMLPPNIALHYFHCPFAKRSA